MNEEAEKKLIAKKNDSDCWNCAGVTFLSSELKKQGKRPICYGMEYKAAKPIDSEQMEALEKLPTISPNTNMYLFGFTQSSARMHRIGQIPVLQYGVKVVVSKKDEEEESTSSDLVSRKAVRPSTANNATNPDRSVNTNTNSIVPSTTLLQRFSDRLFSSKFWENYWKSCTKLFTGMQKLGVESTDSLPERLEKSAMKLGKSCQKTAKKLSDKLVNTVFGDSSDKPK